MRDARQVAGVARRRDGYDAEAIRIARENLNCAGAD
jgi:hypothetical protein